MVQTLKVGLFLPVMVLLLLKTVKCLNYGARGIVSFVSVAVYLKTWIRLISWMNLNGKRFEVKRLFYEYTIIGN